MCESMAGLMGEGKVSEERKHEKKKGCSGMGEREKGGGRGEKKKKGGGGRLFLRHRMLHVGRQVCISQS